MKEKTVWQRNALKTASEVDALAMRLVHSAEYGCLARAKALEWSMDAISIDHFRGFKASLRKRTRGICRWNGHAYAVERVFDCMAMPANDGHFEARDLLDFLDFSHFPFLKNSCAEAVRAND